MNNNTAKNNQVITFTCTRKLFKSDNAEEYFSYGIKAIQNSCVLQEIDDISIDENAVILLAEILTREKASIIHFEDIVLDFIS